MNDTPEDVRIAANNLDDAGIRDTALLLDDYAVLLKRLARPVSDEQIVTAIQTYYGGAGNEANMPNMLAALESYRASLLGNGE